MVRKATDNAGKRYVVLVRIAVRPYRLPDDRRQRDRTGEILRPFVSSEVETPAHRVRTPSPPYPARIVLYLFSFAAGVRTDRAVFLSPQPDARPIPFANEPRP